MCGLTPWHIRVLVDDPWNGGLGFSLTDVSKMTLDQIFMVLSDKKQLVNRTKILDSTNALTLTNADGTIKGRSEDGKPFTAKIVGKSLASKLIEAAKAKRMKEQNKKPRRSR